MIHTPYSQTSLYKQAALRQITGDTLRPGGLEITREALALCNFPSGARLLDAGCGPGETLRWLKTQGFECTGIDMSSAFLSSACKYAPVIQADMHALPLRNACMDGIFCECVLSLATDKEQVLRGIHSVLRPKGMLILSDLMRSGSAPASASPAFSCAQGAISLPDMLCLLHNAGFTVTHQRDYSRFLRELAARMILHFGSVSAFWQLWQNNFSHAPASLQDTPLSGVPPYAAPCGKNMEYLLLIAQKNEDFHETSRC